MGINAGGTPSIKRVGRVTVTIAATGTTFNTTYVMSGFLLTRYVLELPNYTTGSPTTTLSIIDANSITIFTGAAHAETDNYSIPVDIELDGTYTFRLTLSGESGGATSAYLTLFGR